jgi:hypothetical protein
MKRFFIYLALAMMAIASSLSPVVPPEPPRIKTEYFQKKGQEEDEDLLDPF